jgi:hypothetical protein
MSESSDWQLRLGPFRFRITVRTLRLPHAPEPSSPPGDAARLPSPPGALEVGRIRMLDDPPAPGSGAES